ncbi:MAG: hypothetical protein GY860_06440 [Desulfobacteraceae bacterium]|nr:hypothetical protein [Desulfobacteraceae bacterium]
MKLSRFFIMAGLIALVTSCGYHFEGGGYINEDVTRVAVEVFENKSSETRAGMSFTNELIREIQEKTDTIVVDSSKATRKIMGTVNSITFSTLSRSSSESVVERQVKALIDVQLIGPEGDIIWSVKNFSSTEPYTVAEDTVNDENNKRDAVDKIALRSAERLVSKLLSNF